MSEHIAIEASVRYVPKPSLKAFVEELISTIPAPPPSPTPPFTFTEEDWSRYALAFMTPSSKQFVGPPAKTNKLLEYVGDAVIELAVTDWLSQNYSEEDVGKLTYRRQCIVANAMGLTELARELNLERFIMFGQDGKKVLPSVFEAFMGAMFHHLGFEYVRSFICMQLDKFAKDFFKLLPESIQLDIAANNTPGAGGTIQANITGAHVQEIQKTLGQYRVDLQEFLARRGWPADCLSVEHISESVDSVPIWRSVVKVSLGSEGIFQAEGSRGNKKDATGDACKNILEMLRQKESDGTYLSNANVVKAKRARIDEDGSPAPRNMISTSTVETIDYKGHLQRILRKNFLSNSTPVYTPEEPVGLHHDLTFLVRGTLEVNGQLLIAQGEGKKKVEAEKVAAKRLIESLIDKVQHGEMNAIGIIDLPPWTKQ